MYGLVSIHAPAWGATLPICPKGDGSGCFNPRTRVGCDQLSLISGVSDDGVSIHAPAWGATRTARCNRATVMWFQSTHPRGVRPAGHKDCHRSRDGRRKRFNPRTRVGCDAISTAITLTPLCFNPRTRVGCDPPLSRKRLRCLCSFNPRTRVGCDDLVLVDVEQFHFVSIHAPAWGATTRALGCRPTENRFQSTHPRGVRLSRHVRHGRCREVSIHAPAWGATP